MNTFDGIIINDESKIDCKYALTKHVQERYAERIMTSEDLNYNLFISKHAEKIKVDVNKMIYYGECLYKDLPSRDGKAVDVYINGYWIIIVSEKEKRVITLYKIDLGLDPEFNKDYIQKVKDKLKDLSEKKSTLEQQKDSKNSEYLDQIESNKFYINEYRKKIKQIESENENLKSLLENESTELVNVRSELEDTIRKFIGPKV